MRVSWKRTNREGPTGRAARPPRGRRLALVAGLGLLGVLLAFVATLAIPLREWRTGDQGLMPLRYAPAAPSPGDNRRVWIDTDAACGASRTTDPDDCLAIALLLQSRRFSIIGVATTFGNAPRPTVDATVESLLHAAAPAPAIPWFAGAGEPIDASAPKPTHASTALIRALEDGPLVIVALGPLTNIAEALRVRPDLGARVERLVAVMGRRPGHLFHPAAGVAARSFLGHGPVMRDFNYAIDPQAVSMLLATRVPLMLVPYDAATRMEMTERALDRLAATGAAMRWATERARPWLAYWQQDIGRIGFFPFDLVAAALLLAPQAFGCAQVGVRVEVDETLFVPFWRPRALLVSRAKEAVPAQYCGRADVGLRDMLPSLAAE